MRKTILILLTAMLSISLAAIAVNCNGDLKTSAGGPRQGNEPVLTRTVFLSGLSSPWDLAFTPDGAVFFTEKCLGLSVHRADGTVKRLFGTAGSGLVAADFFCQGQSGMLGVAVDPEFGANRFVYVYMASNLGNAKTNRVVRLAVDAGYTTVSSRRDIISDIPYKGSATIWGERDLTAAAAFASVLSTGTFTSRPATTTTVLSRRTSNGWAARPCGSIVTGRLHRETTPRPAAIPAFSPMATAMCRASLSAPAPGSPFPASTDPDIMTR